MNNPHTANNLHFLIDLICFQFIPWPMIAWGCKKHGNWVQTFHSWLLSLVKHCFCSYRSVLAPPPPSSVTSSPRQRPSSGAGVMIHNNNNDNNLGSEAPALHHNRSDQIQRLVITSNIIYGVFCLSVFRSSVYKLVTHQLLSIININWQF